MKDQVADLARRGVALPEDDKARLAELRLPSLGTKPPSEVEAAWNVEIERRLAAYDRGEVRAIDAEEVFAKAELSLPPA